ncbi:MAG: hypothetical protein ACD_23C00497G0001, partial [uncultured bacterium]
MARIMRVIFLRNFISILANCWVRQLPPSIFRAKGLALWLCCFSLSRYRLLLNSGCGGASLCARVKPVAAVAG